MLSFSFLRKDLDSGSNALFLDVATLFGLFIRKDSDSDSKALRTSGCRQSITLSFHACSIVDHEGVLRVP